MKAGIRHFLSRIFARASKEEVRLVEDRPFLSDWSSLAESTGMIRRGHFVRSGLGEHSPIYIEPCRRMPTELLLSFGHGMADLFNGQSPSRPKIVIGVSPGGILLAALVAPLVGAEFCAAQRLRGEEPRGFLVEPGDQVLLVDDVLASGRTIYSTMMALRRLGVQAEQCRVLLLFDRTDGNAFEEIDLPPDQVKALILLPAPFHHPDECPLCRAGMPLEEVG